MSMDRKLLGQARGVLGTVLVSGQPTTRVRGAEKRRGEVVQLLATTVSRPPTGRRRSMATAICRVGGWDPTDSTVDWRALTKGVG
jgi:hypothetical protein